MAKRPLSTEEDARKIARYIGCRGAHQDDKGNWLPCADLETLNRISNAAEKSIRETGKKKHRRRYVRSGYEPLGERGVLGIDSIPGTGLVSGKSIIIGRAKPRKGDPDVYDNPDSARLRARSLGCIGIARRETDKGEVVWTPCTNISDFRRRTGQSVLGRRDETRRIANALSEIGGPEFQRRRLRRFKADPQFGLIEVKAAKRTRRARLASTPAPKKDQVFGSSRNRKGSARSTESAKDIVIDETTLTSLIEKVKAHNEAMRKEDKPSWSLATLNKLKSVYRRGAGAFSVSHRPGMTRGQWALGRVNAFLKLLSSGKPDNPRYVTDNDLLAEDHPSRKRQ